MTDPQLETPAGGAVESRLRRWRRALPALVLLLGIAGSVTLVKARPAVSTRTPGRQVPLVRAVEIERTPIRVTVHAQGSVAPRTESELVSEVAGRIVSVSPSLASGGFVEADEVLVELDAGDYEVAAERARAAVSRTRSEHEVAQTNLGRIRKLHDSGAASPSRLDDAERAAAVADAARRDAAASLRQAERDLERTRVRAPFAGRVREKHVDVGQFVTRGAPVARLYSVDYAEVRLPLTDEDAAFVDLPIAYRDDDGAADGPLVRLTGRFAGREHQWTGRIVRTEGEIDPQTRMIHAVVRVDDPYGRSEDPDRPPLAVGLFVDAEIEGRLLDDAIVLPRSVLRGRDEVVAIDAESRLRLRRVDVLRRERERIVVAGGLEPGDRVAKSPLSFTVDGMHVRVVPEAGTPAGTEIAELGSRP